MNTQPSLGQVPSIGIQRETTVVRDYRLGYEKVETAFQKKYRVIFPPTGHLILNLFFGNGFSLEFLNYDHSADSPNQLYITGLLSQGPLETAQQGRGGGYALKIHPVIGYHFLRVPMHEITDRQVRVSHVFGRQSMALRHCEGNDAIRSLKHPGVDQFLHTFLPKKEVYLQDPIYHAVNRIIGRKGTIHVKELAAEFCMSERTLHRLFLERVGLPPRSYAKIWQVMHAMELLRHNPGAKLPDIAMDAGYYDVAHLARDFRTKLFVKPSKFLQDINPLVDSYLDFPGSIK